MELNQFILDGKKSHLIRKDIKALRKKINNLEEHKTVTKKALKKVLNKKAAQLQLYDEPCDRNEVNTLLANILVDFRADDAIEITKATLRFFKQYSEHQD